MSSKTQFHCPRWEELPEIPLYLDQLVMVIQGAIGVFFDEEQAVTKTMINNYVKQKLLTPPEQKKYGKEHISSIIVISLLKRVFSLTEIQFFISKATENYGQEQAYNEFCQRFEKMLASAFEPSSTDIMLPVSRYNTKLEYILDAVLLALVCKLKVQDEISGFIEKKE